MSQEHPIQNNHASKHGHGRRGKNRSAEYRAWSAMIQRCTNKKGKHHHYYIDKGIIVCKRWRESFESFLSDIGTRPSPKHSLDRINNDGNYEPSNCRWATRQEQMLNCRRNRRLQLGGVSMTISQWAIFTGLSFDAIRHRLKRGWTVEKTLTTPTRNR